MVELVTCMNDEDPSKYEGNRVLTNFVLLLVFGGVSQTLNGSNMSPQFDLAKFQPHPRFYDFTCFLQE